jgi:hypothetical protein
MEVESAAVLASTRGVAEGFAWRIARLEGVLVDLCQARDTAEPNSRCLFPLIGGRRRPRGSAKNGFRSLPFCNLGVPSCPRP